MVDETSLHRIIHLLNGGTVRMTPYEQLGLFTSLRALAMGEFCGAVVPEERKSAAAPEDVEDSEAEDPEWQSPISAVPIVKRKRGRPRTREPMIGPKRPRGRPRLPENMLRERRGKPIGAQVSANNVARSRFRCREQEVITDWLRNI